MDTTLPWFQYASSVVLSVLCLFSHAYIHVYSYIASYNRYFETDSSYFMDSLCKVWLGHSQLSKLYFMLSISSA